MTINYEIKYEEVRRRLSVDVRDLVWESVFVPIHRAMRDTSCIGFDTLTAQFRSSERVQSIRNQLVTAKNYEEGRHLTNL
jgi:hypothetical protein